MFFNFFKKKESSKENSPGTRFLFYECPFIFFIKQNIDYLLSKILVFYPKIGLYPVIGLEIEFYLSNQDACLKDLRNDVNHFCISNEINIIEVKREAGVGQFEISMQPYNDIQKLLVDYNLLKTFLINRYNASFAAYDFNMECPNALQININFVNNLGKNLFARKQDSSGKTESFLLRNMVAGILNTTNIFLPLYIYSEHCTIRYNIDFNKNLYKKGKIHAPVYLTWGINNRSAAIRIPIPLDFKKYEELDNKQRRIEYRVPSAAADLKLVIYGVLVACLYGLNESLEPIEKISSNTLLLNKEYNLKTIDLEDMKLNARDHLDIFKKYILLDI